MEEFILWYGVRQIVNGNDVSCITEVSFTGEYLGKSCNPVHDTDHSGVDTSFFRLEDGRILAHIVHWTRIQNEPTLADIRVFNSMDDAKVQYRLEMERAGVIPWLRMTLDEFLNR
jgi:hypothetical protein